ncbi:MAG: glycosyltransferase [Gemmataceae bacterium]|nr:glycosyltransferase [Gemmataceae bacterium]
MSEPSLSLVIPLFNERDSLVELHRQISSVAQHEGLSIEIVFIDDGSSDGSWEMVKELASNDPRVRGLRFRRNFGKAAALQAGFREARGTRIMTLDADLQDDPAEIPKFLAEMDTGIDLVVGWKKIRHDPWHKVLPSRLFNGVVSWTTGVKLHDHNCGMKAYTADIVREIRLYGEMHRFVPVLAAARGFRVGEVVIQHRARQHGHSKFGLNRFLRGFLDLITVKYLTTHGRRPMHLFGGWALLASMIFVLIAIAGVCWSPPLSGLTLLGILLSLIVPLLFFVNGLQAELAVASRTDDAFSIAERVGPSRSAP